MLNTIDFYMKKYRMGRSIQQKMGGVLAEAEFGKNGKNEQT